MRCSIFFVTHSFILQIGLKLPKPVLTLFLCIKAAVAKLSASEKFKFEKYSLNKVIAYCQAYNFETRIESFDMYKNFCLVKISFGRVLPDYQVFFLIQKFCVDSIYLQLKAISRCLQEINLQLKIQLRN